MAEREGTTGKSETAKREEEVLAFWRENKTFERSLEKDAPKGEFVFYDGPPFATGLPHHGSLLSSIIKDVIPRYKTMRGYRVRRRWGWDTHGLPIETLVEKELGLKTKKDIETLGVDKFNAKAREMVMKFVDEWEKYVERIGRWVDFKNSYKTMDNTYIGSVWWALKEIYSKGLLYEGRKVLMYCPHCETPLAKAEIAMDNTYQDVTEEAVTVKFELVDHPGTYFLAWTTTPWTLPGNIGLAVGGEIEYVKARIVPHASITDRTGTHHVTETTYIYIAKDILEKCDRAYPGGPYIYGNEFGLVIEEEIKGEKLIGLKYRPLFDVPALKSDNSYKVWPANFVTTSEGTGIVHIAPMYGEDDFTLGVNYQLPTAQLLNANGTYNDLAPEFLRDIYLRDANKDIKRDLQERGLLFARENHTHSYPHCYRCGTPLIYNAVPSWFINIQKVKARMLEENERVNWVPEHLKHGRFKNIVESAPDWTISRNRFWASPLPIWKSKEGEVMVVGSLGELKEKVKKSGNTYFMMRHGEADTNVKGVLNCDPKADVHITERGKNQVQEAALKFKVSHGHVDIIVASPFKRTRDSVAILAKTLGVSEKNVRFDERLGEYDLGKLNGITLDDWHEKFPASVERFSHGPDGGENDTKVKQRMGAVLTELEREHKGKTILIISHGTPLWLLHAAATGASKEEAVRRYKREYPVHGEIETLSYVPIPVNSEYELDLHRPYTDSIVLVDEEGKEYERIKEVVDCWVESGCMPFAEYHYPFENKEEFEKRAPGDFIAEYIAQTRTWFYYLHAIGVILFDRLTFRNVVTTGTIVAADGSKMSKSKGNYTDPLELIALYGADALRLYLMSSPVMQAEDLRFRDEDVRDAHNRVIGILWNSYKFFELYSHEFDGSAEARKSAHVLDRWILARLDETIEEMTDAMESYDTPRACRAIRAFVDDYSTWYVRRSRERVKSEWHEKQFALSVQRDVLLTFSRLIAPIMPFLAESIWRGIEGGGSVHLQEWLAAAGKGLWARLFGAKEETILEEMAAARAFVTKALEARDKAGIKVRQPLTKLEIGSTTLSKELRDVIREEVNVKEVALSRDVPAGDVRLDTNITPELKEEGFVRDLIRAIQNARKEAGLSPHDTAQLTIDTTKETQEFIEKHKAEIENATRTTIAFSAVHGARQKIGEWEVALLVTRSLDT